MLKPRFRSDSKKPPVLALDGDWSNKPMQKTAAVWREGKDMEEEGLTVAIPNSTVERYRSFCLQPAKKDLSSEEIRKTVERLFKNGFATRTMFSPKFGRDGFGIKFTVAAAGTFWLICNRDTKTNYDYVAVTIYDEDMFQKRQNGLPFRSSTAPMTVAPVVVPHPDELSLEDDGEDDGAAFMAVLTEEDGSEKTTVFDTEAEVMAYVKTLYDEGYEPATDCKVWKRLKLSVNFSMKE